DDNVDAVEALALWLESLGHEALVAHDGSQAVETARRALPDLVLLDIGLPGMSGHDVARALRACADLREATLVALSGWGTDDDRAESTIACGRLCGGRVPTASGRRSATTLTRTDHPLSRGSKHPT